MKVQPSSANHVLREGTRISASEQRRSAIRALLGMIPLFGLTTSLSGCSIATGEKFHGLEETESDLASLYVLRIENGMAALTMGHSIGEFPDMTINGIDLGSLKRGGYLFSKIRPGFSLLKTKNTISYSAPLQESRFTAVAGGRYFFVFSTRRLSSTPRVVIGVSLHQVSEDMALAWLKDLVRSN